MVTIYPVLNQFSFPMVSCRFLIDYSIEFLWISASKNRFSVESVDNNNGIFTNDKKPRVGFSKLIQYSINTITELPEKALDDER
jgi:hypothetical protein